MGTEYTPLWHKMFRKKLALLRECSLVSIIFDADYLKYYMIYRSEFAEKNAGMDVNYFDLMEELLLTWDNFSY